MGISLRYSILAGHPAAPDAMTVACHRERLFSANSANSAVGPMQRFTASRFAMLPLPLFEPDPRRIRLVHNAPMSCDPALPENIRTTSDTSRSAPLSASSANSAVSHRCFRPTAEDGEYTETIPLAQSCA